MRSIVLCAAVRCGVGDDGWGWESLVVDVYLLDHWTVARRWLSGFWILHPSRSHRFCPPCPAGQRGLLFPVPSRGPGLRLPRGVHQVGPSVWHCRFVEREARAVRVPRPCQPPPCSQLVDLFAVASSAKLASTSVRSRRPIRLGSSKLFVTSRPTFMCYGRQAERIRFPPPRSTTK
jgi:hypothetical protein